MASKRLLQESYKPLHIEVPEFKDPKVTEWARRVEEQVNRVLIRIMQQNQDRMLAALFSGLGGITTAGATMNSILIPSTTGNWTIKVVGDELQVIDHNDVIQGAWKES